MNKPATMPVVLLLAFVAGCSEGGIGGTGSVVAGPAPVALSGQANKGPFDAGALVTATQLVNSAGQVQSQTTGKLGQFTLSLSPDATYLVQVSGGYYSETSGSVVDTGIALAAVVQPQSNVPANVNVATHLIYRRVQSLVSGGMSFDTSIDTATNELVLALSSVLPAPANPVVFSQLVLINAVQAAPNEEGNAWLLALSALVDTVGGSDVGALLDSLSLEFAAAGTLAASTLAPLDAAVSQIDPDSIHQNLINLEPSFSENALVASGSFTADQAALVTCRVFGSSLLCAGAGGLPAGSLDSTLSELADSSSQSVSIAAVVADLNRFIDTDRDGLVNEADPDDDNDGIEDSADATPYDNQLPGSPGGVM